MRTNGFTLVELMGVIAILAILSVVTVVGFDKMVLNSKQELYDSQVTMIELSAKEWLTENPSFKPTDDEPLLITLDTLVKSGYIKGNIKNPKTNKDFDLSTQIKITKNGNTYNYELID